MRIFTSIKHSLDPTHFYGGLWSGNFYPALRELGCEIVESQIDLLPASRFMHIAESFTKEEQAVRVRITRGIVEEVKKAHHEKTIDLFLSYFYNAHFDPTGFDEIHRLGIPTVNFYCNSLYQFKYVEAIARKVNYSWHTEKNARPLYLETGANPVWIQMGADPEIYHPILNQQREGKACFVGQRYADRDRFIGILLGRSIPLEIFGPGWQSTASNNGPLKKIQEKQNIYLGRETVRPGSFKSYLHEVGKNMKGQGMLEGSKRTLRQLQYQIERRRLTKALELVIRGGGIDFREISQTFSRYEVVLNFSNVWTDGRPGSKLIPHVRLRDFEAPMCRTCYLTGHSEEIAEFYEIGKEIDAYRSPEELADKIRFYLSHPAEAEKLRQAGYERARRDHAWVNRFRQLFRIIALS